MSIFLIMLCIQNNYFALPNSSSFHNYYYYYYENTLKSFVADELSLYFPLEKQNEMCLKHWFFFLITHGNVNNY